MGSRAKFLVVVLCLHLPLFAYPIVRLCYWLDLSVPVTVAIFVPLFFSQVIVRLYFRHANSGMVFWARRVADLWLGISPLLLCALILAEFPVAMGWFPPRTTALVLIGFTVLLTLFSVANAYSPSVVKVALSSQKLTEPLRFVQITDVHIGSRSAAFLQRVMRQVNGLDAAFLCITGDFIDAPNIGEVELSVLGDCPIPVYFSIGNHERYEDLEDILSRLRNLGVQVLRSATAEHKDVQLVGIDDSDNPRQVERELARVAIDLEKFVLLLYHRPRGLEAAARAGVDLMISGHTHNGQIVPFNFVVGRVFERVVGLFREGDTSLYVSPGTGTWGPVMRLGSRGEITLFEITPTH